MRLRAAVMPARPVLSVVRVRGPQAWLIAVGLAAVTALCAGTIAPAQPAFAASTTTTFAARTDALSAVFAPASTSNGGSPGTRSLAVDGTAGSEAVMVTVPPAGTLTVTVVPGTVTLQGTGNRLEVTGMLQDVTVTDTRNYVPGWSVSGQESVFIRSRTAGGATIPGDQLGWVPVAVSPLAGGASLGPAVAPGTRRHGLGTGSALAYADAGSGIGTNTLSASLILDIRNSRASRYTGILTITYLETGPQAGGTAGVGGNF
jgi:hypothetical protein